VSSIWSPSRRKAKTFPIAPRSPRLAALMQSCPAILGINWCFQGMRGMDRGELVFRLTLELVLFAALVPALGAFGAFVLAHSFNFTFNGQLWVCARYCRLWRRSPAAVERFLRGVAAELRELPWLEEAVCIGSRGAGTEVRHDRADIDLRLIAPGGASGWLKVNLLLLALRTRALLQLVPLDLYAYDSPESLARFRQDEPLLVILDRRGRIARRFAERQLVPLR
jgi:hypothetical protein